ncbi:MAG TPA: DUF6529 family protein [Kineosporiaceae bacterium]
MSFDAAPPPHPSTDQPPPSPTPGDPAPGLGEGAAMTGALLVVLLAGGAVSVALGAFGQVHPPTGVAINIAGFSGPLEVKVWLASLAAALVLLQLVSALAMYGRLPVRAPSWTGRLHRWSGRLAFLAAVPVAMHCLYALGFQSYDTRVLVHSLVGCLFFGAFTIKMLSLTRSDLPGWLLPALGGVVFTGLTVLWLTSSLWFFTTVGVRF